MFMIPVMFGSVVGFGIFDLFGIVKHVVPCALEFVIV